MLDILSRLQTPEGGIITDYDRKLRPVGLPNAETTSIVLMALDAPKPAKGRREGKGSMR
jgi:hypothetical protein